MPGIANTGYEMVPIARLRVHPRNPRKGNVDAILESIRANDFYGAVVVQRSTRRVLAGNHRLLAAKRAGLAELPVIWIDCDDDRALRILLADNRTNDVAGYDDGALAALLGELAVTPSGLAGTGYDSTALEELLDGLGGGESDVNAEPQINRAEELRAKWGTATGQLWALGEHRLLCGDSTKAEDVARVMGGGRAEFCFTDPPYGVQYSGRGRSTGEQDIENDDLDPAELRTFLAAVFRLMPLLPASNVFICHADQKPGIRPAFEGALSDASLRMLGTVIWLKNAASMGWQDFRAQHEPILFACTEGEGRVRVEDRTATTVWPVDREAAGGYLHPTTKPVALVRTAMCYCCPAGAVVYEPFSGSGTTIIACEQLGRKCRAIEISPAYVAVALERWAEVTGKTPTLVT